MGFGENQVEVVKGKTPYILTGDILVVNYDVLHDWMPSLINYRAEVLICDEVQYIKSNKAKRTKAVRRLSKHIPHFIALSGTPIVNRPIEFYNTIQIINPDLFPNWLHYTQRYCNRRHNGFGWDISGASHTDELHEILSDSIMIRRSKAEVLKDLPDKIRSFFPIEMDTQIEKEYNEAENNFVQWMEKSKGLVAAERASNAEALAQIEILKQMAVKAKLPHAIEWIQDFLYTGQKLVVFCTHHFTIDALMNKFGNIAVKLDGRTSGPKRQLVVEKFQNEAKTRLFVGNIKAAGVGITLTAASTMAFLELPWTTGELIQAEDRLHRIGQKDSVNVYYLLAEFTIEEKIAQLLDQKRKVLDSVLDGIQTDDKSLLTELIQNYQP
jgi:SWI/SNF-related matrix-associated actin-dependent regulator 1 of chromatin subfamily A